MKEEVLEDMGLSKNESKIFLVLLDMGSSTAGVVAEKCKLHRTNVYDALERLIEKGLVAYVLKKDVKYFEATDPENLMGILKEKEENLRKVMPELLLSRKFAKKTEVHVYEGVLAARRIFMGLLRYNQPILIFGVPKEAPYVLKPHFLEQFHKQRIEKKIVEKVIYNEDALPRIQELKKIPLLEVKTLPKEFNSPMSTNICGDEVFLELFRDNPLTIQIKNKEIADMYIKYFEILWNASKKI